MSQRDKVLAMILPAICIAAAYLVFFLVPGNTQLEEMESRMRSAEAGIVSEDQLLAARQKETKLRNELIAVQKKIKLASDELDALASTVNKPVNQAVRVRRITELLKKHQMHIIETGFADRAAGGADASFPASIAQVLNRLGERTKQTSVTPRVWRIRIVGSFTQAKQVLEQLCDDENYGVPIGLAMEESLEDTNLHIWTLTIWI